ncbi:iron ABC transporter permease [Allokutzneria oryzae]|uniref:Iron ABC transporter permease n=1 Tax=Allokutzneria oryzae TaxID=1378989 RepID=A0ABV5ZPF6_9PSEU
MSVTQALRRGDEVDGPRPRGPQETGVTPGRGGSARWLFAALPVLVLGLAFVSILVGAGHIGPGRTLGYLFGGIVDPQLEMVVTTLRVPRTVVAVLIGCALGVSGALLQAATRNPLADTGLLGVNNGAALGVVAGITFAGAESGAAYLAWAFTGALLASAVVLLLATFGRGAASPLRLVLAGSALGATLAGATSFILLSDPSGYDRYRFWVLGSLSGVTLEHAVQVLPAVAIGLAAAVLVARPLSALALGEDAARALGHRPGVIRLVVAGGVALIAGAAVSLAGPIAFLGLLAPYVARALVGTRMVAQLVMSGIIGALALLGADVLARIVVRPFEAPVSVLLALIGAPALVLIARSRKLLSLSAPEQPETSGGRAAKSAPGKAKVQPPDSFVLRAKDYSLLVPRRATFAAAGMLVVLAIAVVASTVLGQSTLSPDRALAALFGEGSRAAQLLIQEIRLPRIVSGLLAGAALGAAGCLTQSLARNRLATPDLLGVNNGATVAVLVISMSSAAGMIGAWWAGPLGALLAAVAVLLVAGGMGSQGSRVIVVGLAMSTAIGSLTNLVLSFGNLHTANAIFTWTIGSLNGRDYGVALPVGIVLAVLLPVTVLAARQLALLRLGEDTAATLGLNRKRAQVFVLAMAVALAGIGVGIGGPVVFVAMAAPIIASRLAGPVRVPVVGSALAGAVLVVAADTIGRVATPTELPVGVITTLLGGPFLMWVLLRGDSK